MATQAPPSATAEASGGAAATAVQAPGNPPSSVAKVPEDATPPGNGEDATPPGNGEDATPPGNGEDAPSTVWLAEGDPPPEPDIPEPSSVIDILNEDDQLEAASPGDDEPPANAGDEKSDQDLEAGAPEDQASVADQGEKTGSDANTADAPSPTSEQDLAQSDDALFPSSPIIDRQKAFWIQIFTKYDSHQGLLHDGRIALPVYRSVDLRGMKYREQRRFIRARKREIATALLHLAETLRHGGQPDEQERGYLALLPKDVTATEVREFARNVRFQRGLADRFRRGLVRSGAILDKVRAILKENGVPEDLVYLPHVESSFNNRTLSKFGAAGIWQFTRGTGRQYLDVGYEVDERLDPIMASKAAAAFLYLNYKKLGTWPLAITAYNHGPNSLKGIVRRMGTRDLGVLIKRYNGRLFRFASKNFYAEFLAAREVATHYADYFGKLDLAPPLRFAKVELPFYLPADEAADLLQVKLDDLRQLNPALRHPVWNGTKYIPKGYDLRIPPGSDPKRFLAAVPPGARKKKQKLTSVVVVARGDSLYSIGRRNGVAWRAIAEANNITATRRLRPGQKLIIPHRGLPLPPAPVKAKNEVVAASMAPESDATPVGITATVSLAEEQAVAGLKGSKFLQDDRTQDWIRPELYEDLKMISYDPRGKSGEIVASYGETLGYYADWAEVGVRDIRRFNGMGYRTRLQPGQSLLIPLQNVTPQEFDRKRVAFHQSRVENFFAEYNITQKVTIRVRRGQSPWDIAQNNNVPMWLFYRENPQLLTESVQPGMQVVLPVVQQTAQN